MPVGQAWGQAWVLCRDRILKASFWSWKLQVNRLGKGKRKGKKNRRKIKIKFDLNQLFLYLFSNFFYFIIRELRVWKCMGFTSNFHYILFSFIFSTITKLKNLAFFFFYPIFSFPSSFWDPKRGSILDIVKKKDYNYFKMDPFLKLFLLLAFLSLLLRSNRNPNIFPRDLGNNAYSFLFELCWLRDLKSHPCLLE